MNKNNYKEQNGRPSYILQGSTPPAEPRTRNASLTLPESSTSICRDFIWGICSKGSRCAFRHERDVECMKTVLKFCHDFQNKTGCLRGDCMYLHTSREEQTLFLNKGQIPKALADRYATMSVPSTTAVTVNGTHGGESVAQSSRGAISSLPVTSTSPKALRGAIPSLLMPPPPPPATIAVTHHQTSPIMTAPLTLNMPAPQQIQQVSTLPPIFDATKPPPPLPMTVKLCQKRKAAAIEAGPSKARKLEESEGLDNLCDICVQRQIRVELFRQDLIKAQTTKDDKNDVYKRRCEEFEHSKLLMRSLVNQELFKFLEDYVEEEPSSSTQTKEQSPFSPMSSLASGLNTTNKPFMAQLLGHMFDNGTRNLLEPPPPALVNNVDNSILKSLTSLAQPRSSPVKNGTAEVFQTLLDLMCERKVPESARELSEARTSDLLNTEMLPGTPGLNSVLSTFTQLVNSQKGKSPSPELVSTVQSIQSMSPTSFGNTVVGVPNTLVTSPPPNYVQFHPNVPPPNTRPVFSPTIPTISPTNMPNANTFNPPPRMNVPPPMATRPTSPNTSSPPQHLQNSPQYPGNFPMSPNYFPSYQ